MMLPTRHTGSVSSLTTPSPATPSSYREPAAIIQANIMSQTMTKQDILPSCEPSIIDRELCQTTYSTFGVTDRPTVADDYGSEDYENTGHHLLQQQRTADSLYKDRLEDSYSSFSAFSVIVSSNAGSFSSEIQNKFTDHVKKSPSVPKRTCSLSSVQSETDVDRSRSNFVNPSTEAYSASPLQHISEQHSSMINLSSEAHNQNVTQAIRKKKAPVPIPKVRSQPPEGTYVIIFVTIYIHICICTCMYIITYVVIYIHVKIFIRSL